MSTHTGHDAGSPANQPAPSAEPASPSPAGKSAMGRVLKIGAQILGFAIGLGLLTWCVRIALQPRNREALAHLQDASAGQIAMLIGLSLVVVYASGAAFRETLRPIKRLPMMEAQATNVIACLLALLPFKLSVFFRVFIHNRRDRVPLLTIGAWFSAVGVVILCVLVPMLGASFWRRGVDVPWVASTFGGMAALLTTVLFVARALREERGWAWVQSHSARLPLPDRVRAGSNFSTAMFEKAHEGVRMLASPRVVFGCALLRLIDLGSQAGRIALAAAILHVPLHWDHALLAGCTFFLIGAAAPTGQLGTREAGTAKLIAIVLPNIDLDQFIPVVLTVTGVEAAVLLVGSVIGAAYLRPWKLAK